MSHITHATYTGDIGRFKGQTAILRYEAVEGVLAQFDNHALHVFDSDWIWFPLEDFSIIEEKK